MKKVFMNLLIYSAKLESSYSLAIISGYLTSFPFIFALECEDIFQ